MKTQSTKELQQELEYVRRMLRFGVAGKKYARQTARRFHALRAELAHRENNPT